MQMTTIFLGLFLLVAMVQGRAFELGKMINDIGNQVATDLQKTIGFPHQVTSDLLGAAGNVQIPLLDSNK
ncbi:hypothetical protein D910_11772 [Dendroctonus ponderosae]|uniref:Uncharacterized protein n=1 Tax=Dendroctonus ponderosae TaxID=77166 RepID=U4UW81_DENPD|nr:hypothetical protein D910_11772 [Dendroctonus ponderosae]KAH1028023.1 hypothetical protein HUJ05_001430 [Dendroctonus ponderosae]